MHFHCEVVIPPTADIEGAVALVMKPFNEASDDETERRNGFWDFYRIGGRWAGHKLMARYDSAKVEAFEQWCRDEGITVSAVQFGKQELSPASQIPKVDAKWNEMFPSAIPVPCPLFRHSNDQFGQGLSGTLPQDVCRLSDMPKDLTCARVIFAKPSYQHDVKDWTGPLEPGFMLCEDQWNGYNHMKVDWDCRFDSALAKYRDNMKHARAEYVAKVMPREDWLVVTVDYHS